jgi:hypothetical protein
MTQESDLLQTLFAGYGLYTEGAEGDWLKIGNHPARIRVRATHETPQQGQTAIHIEVDVKLPSGKVITEWFVGQEKNRELATRDAVRAFSMSGAHLLLNAVWNVPIQGQVETQSWQAAGQRWRAWLGPFVIWGKDERAPQNIAPPNLVEAMRAAVTQTQLDPEINWFRFIHCSVGDGQKVISEAAKNNQPWPEGEAFLKSLKWPPIKEYWSFRHFAILTREHA